MSIFEAMKAHGKALVSTLQSFTDRKLERVMNICLFIPKCQF